MLALPAPAGMWVATRVSTYAYMLAAGTGFRRLFRYIQASRRSQPLPISQPVLAPPPDSKRNAAHACRVRTRATSPSP
jgi:hypothetical protein